MAGIQKHIACRQRRGVSVTAAKEFEVSADEEFLEFLEFARNFS